MKHFMFSVYDEKAHAFYPPWFLAQTDMALRVFSDCVNDKEHNFGMHPSDYSLFAVGEFEDSTAVIFPDKHALGNGVEFVRGFSTQPDLLSEIDPVKFAEDRVAEVKRVNALVDGEDNEAA